MPCKNEMTDSFQSNNGLNIFYRFCKADTERARMVISHGLGEHSGRYSHVIDNMIENGILLDPEDDTISQNN